MKNGNQLNDLPYFFFGKDFKKTRKALRTLRAGPDAQTYDRALEICKAKAVHWTREIAVEIRDWELHGNPYRPTTTFRMAGETDIDLQLRRRLEAINHLSTEPRVLAVTFVAAALEGKAPFDDSFFTRVFPQAYIEGRDAYARFAAQKPSRSLRGLPGAAWSFTDCTPA